MAAGEYQQQNPQTTDIRGIYSFLVPEGSYYIGVEAPGYKPYQGKIFIVAEGNGVHQNIELVAHQSWFSFFDWKTVITIITFLLVVYFIFRVNKRT